MLSVKSSGTTKGLFRDHDNDIIVNRITVSSVTVAAKASSDVQQVDISNYLPDGYVVIGCQMLSTDNTYFNMSMTSYNTAEKKLNWMGRNLSDNEITISPQFLITVIRSSLVGGSN